MKKLNIIIVILSLILIGYKAESQVGISATAGFTPDSKAMLDVSSTSKGLLIPRMNSAQRMGIPTPSASLMVYDTNTESFWYYKNSTEGWKEIGSGSAAIGWTLLGNSGINPASQFVGTTDATALSIRTQSTERMHITKDGQVGIGLVPSSNDLLSIENKKYAFSSAFISAIPFGALPTGDTYGVYSKNVNETMQNRYGGYFESTGGQNFMSSGQNIGVFGYANISASNGIGVYGKSDTYGLAGYFEGGNVKIDKTLAVGMHPTTANHFEILKNASKNAGFINLPVIGKDNNIYFGRNIVGNSDIIGLEINLTNTPSNRALEVNGNTKLQGTVGINTLVVPTNYQLAVNGKIIATELRIQNSSLWPDYVFAKNYKLPKLNEVEQHILAKKHLPNVPSAADVAENGIIVGDMQKTLLRKIEELTLYIIDQQKQIDSLRADLSKLVK
jgi:hypothetical protein